MSSKNILEKQINVTFTTKNNSLASSLKDALSHGFSSLEMTVSDDWRLTQKQKCDVSVIDVSSMKEDEIENILDSISGTPQVFVMQDFHSLRKFAKHMSGLRTFVTASDLSGMGAFQAVHNLLERKKLKDELDRTTKNLKELSIRDEATGLYNNRHFHDLLTTEVKKATRYKRPLALVMLCIKNISEITANFGHTEALHVISKTADAIRGAIRTVDIPARSQEGEFSLVLPETDEQAAKVVAKRIQSLLKNSDFANTFTSKPVISCGVSAICERVTSKEDLIRTAALALTEAKRSGENTVYTSEDIEAKKHGVKENKQLIEQLGERLSKLASDAQKNYFQSLMRAIGEIPVLKKSLLPHSERVAFYGKRLAEACGLPESKANAIYRAGLLHDCGKLAIDASILSKPDRLTLPEQELMQKHPIFAAQILGHTPFLSEEMSAILNHHERFDGEGYPEHIAGESIPISARILAIAESWDVMTSPQPYRTEPLPLNKALAEMSKGAGTQFDPQLVKVFSSLIAG